MEEEGGGFRLSKRFSDKGGEVDYKTKAGTAWSHNFLNQKPWHPLSYPNQRRKWIAEQTHAQREQRANEIAREVWFFNQPNIYPIFLFMRRFSWFGVLLVCLVLSKSFNLFADFFAFLIWVCVSVCSRTGVFSSDCSCLQEREREGNHFYLLSSAWVFLVIFTLFNPFFLIRTVALFG